MSVDGIKIRIECRLRLGQLRAWAIDSLPQAPSFPRQGPQDIHVPLSSLTPVVGGGTGLDARPRIGVPARPQRCNCGANQLLSVAHLETCKARGSAR